MFYNQNLLSLFTCQKLKRRAADFGIDMLEELVVPVNPAADLTKCKATVRLNITGSHT